MYESGVGGIYWVKLKNYVGVGVGVGGGGSRYWTKKINGGYIGQNCRCKF